ncbi:uncharacterized protein EAE98_010898 [Botrytis deweyae]|uniref:Uncharacterized protein n=1 Tax=Botrytis deweyae TaxID=2478750 RepID=A0ABQ7I7I6_9HELO|nr:uncharacterized protein EAE98_010898 [Botrytis deweyae]KAF7916043.1 hypothetical protein EAE98_010898 [Botrytis deweyae]
MALLAGNTFLEESTWVPTTLPTIIDFEANLGYSPNCYYLSQSSLDRKPLTQVYLAFPAIAKRQHMP